MKTIVKTPSKKMDEFKGHWAWLQQYLNAYKEEFSKKEAYERFKLELLDGLLSIDRGLNLNPSDHPISFELNVPDDGYSKRTFKLLLASDGLDTREKREAWVDSNFFHRFIIDGGVDEEYLRALDGYIMQSIRHEYNERE